MFWQNSLATAITNFTKPHAKIKFWPSSGGYRICVGEKMSDVRNVFLANSKVRGRKMKRSATLGQMGCGTICEHG